MVQPSHLLAISTASYLNMISIASVYCVSGVHYVLVNLMAQRAEVKYDPAYIIPSQIANHVTDLGYAATLLEGETVGQSSVEVHVCYSITQYCLYFNLTDRVML